MKSTSRLVPSTIEGQMVAVLAVSIVLLLCALVALDFSDRRSAIEWAESNTTLSRVARMKVILENVIDDRRRTVLETLSSCHDGYTLSDDPYDPVATDPRTIGVRETLAKRLKIETSNVSVGSATLTRSDFSYALCDESEINLPMRAIVIGVQLDSGGWLNVEVHPHEWHVNDLLARIFRYSAALILVGMFAFVLIRRLTRPLKDLTVAATQFADGLNVSPVEEYGPTDLRRAIRSFNAMQEQVANDIRQRTETLAAINHDLRTPLTALRIRAELVEDDQTRRDLVSSIDKMERVTSSALEYLRAQSETEEPREVDLTALLASECTQMEETGFSVTFSGEEGVRLFCRPDSLARAIRNLIENANKYGDGACVTLAVGEEHIEISASDHGPGIPRDKFTQVLEPFHRLSLARESQQGGFGLGLAIVNAVAKSHGGELILESNHPTGLVATLRLPLF